MALGITHSYYSDGRCADLELVPTPRTEEIAQNHRCTLRRRADGVTLIAPTDPRKRLEIPFDAPATLSFRLRMVDSTLPMFTDFGELTRQGAPLFTNAGGGSESALSLVSTKAWGAERLVVASPAKDIGFVLAGRPAAGVAVGDFEMQGAESVRVIDFDANQRPIRLDASSASPGQSLMLRYPAQPGLEWGVFANVEIHTANVLPKTGESTPSAPHQFRIALKAKQMKWVYYFITDLKKQAGTLQIVDAARTGAELAFGAANQTELNETPDASDPIASQLAERYPSLRRVRFVCDQTVPSRQAPRKNIELRLKGNRLYSALPNPSFHNYSALNLSGGTNTPRQETLFEIVKHVANPFPTKGA